MEREIIECVPNFSQGRDIAVVEAIERAIRSVDGVKVLNVDRGQDANRTVFTYAGAAGAVCEASFRAVELASQQIDMRVHHGAHPRIGVADVIPLVPVSGITLAEVVPYARALAARVGAELSIPVYCYQAAAFDPSRCDLAACRSGEYEGLASKMTSKAWRPDFGPTEFTPSVARTGAAVIGAREYLVAVNFNLNTSDIQVAKNIARDIRAARRSGQLEGIKAIGWYMPEYGFAQVSTNLTSIDRMPLHTAWQLVGRVAAQYGHRVTGTEIIGLVPRRVLSQAGAFFAAGEQMSERAQLDLVVEKMGLSNISPFEPEKRIIENLL
ncbi:MAG: glutamate formimidoyltransferase [Mucinivorans sp.]